MPNRNKKKVNLFIVGAMKCGTTSLYEYLMQHPDIYFPLEKKEMNYFATDLQEIPHNDPGAYHLHDIKLIYRHEDYEKYYEKCNSSTYLGDASPEYLYYYKSAEAIYKYNPSAKIIISIRNPIDRAFSAYMHLRKNLITNLSFVDVIQQCEENKTKNYLPIWDLIGAGMYYESVNHYMEVFGKENVHVILFDDLRNDSMLVMGKICDFLHIKGMKFETHKIYNSSGIPKNKIKMEIYMLMEKHFILIKKIIPASLKRKIQNKAKKLFVTSNLEKVRREELCKGGGI